MTLGAVIACIACLCAGFAAAAFLFNLGANSVHVDDLNDDIPENSDDADLQLALNSKVEEAAAQRVADAVQIAATMEKAANVLLNAAHTERSAADALTAAAAQSKRLAEEVALLRQVCDSIDVQQGGLLTALENFGMVKTTVARSARTRQVGEPDPEHMPPSLEGGGGHPLDNILR